MPIITPVYPQQNSSFNVSPSSRMVMRKAFADGHRVIENIKEGRATWHDLFEPYNFFGEYVHYVALFASSLTPEHQIAWTGFIQSKIRHLIGEEAVNLILLCFFFSFLLPVRSLHNESVLNSSFLFVFRKY